jgi:hypothetical protein
VSSGGVEGECAGSNKRSQGGTPKSCACVSGVRCEQKELRRGAVGLTYLGVGEERKAVISGMGCGEVMRGFWLKRSR